MCSAWLIRRFPARDNRWRTWSPEDTPVGAVPLQLANLSLVANRETSPVSARIRPAISAPTLNRLVSEVPVAATRSLIWAAAVFSLASSDLMSATSLSRIGNLVK
jgi:hypothetical protein